MVERDGREILTADEIISRSQALTKRLLGGKPEAGLDAFLAERRTDGDSG